ncbi:hypothetical protein [Kocuria sp.]|uniref:hypothetical protein n=1 Tax=Kocuria sp. TaxID=1871328 RepID=UPI0026DFBFC5|nr:hypothetical protein [Kocuria sp.]MDO5619361.1 hypothetical protein [Kocuria sp.]
MNEQAQPCTASMESVLTRPMDAVATPIGEVNLDAASTGARRTVRAAGVITEVGIAPAQANAQFTALLTAGPVVGATAPTQPVRLIWQGQRAVPGVSVGVVLDCVGLLCHRESQPTIFNPRYEIVAKKVQR